MYKKLALILFSLLITGVTGILVKQLSLLYFFDIFYYYKSAAHGYIVPNITFPDSYLPRAQSLQLMKVGSLSSSSPDRCNIVIIGDSYVWGQGVTFPQTFVAQLEKRLNKIKPTNVHLLGLPGNSTLDNLMFEKEVRSQLKPDLVLVASLFNDLLHSSEFSLTYVPTQELHQLADTIINGCTSDGKSLIPDASCHQDKCKTVTQEDFIKIIGQSFSDQFANKCIHETSIGYFDQSTLFFDYGEPFNHLESSTYFNSLFEQHQLEHHTLKTNFKSKQQAIITNKEQHPSPEAHRQFAESLFDIISHHQLFLNC